MLLLTSVLLTLAANVDAHVVGWAKGMYCLGGTNPASDDPNTSTAVNPLWMLSQDQWWFQADRGCDKVPPADGVFLELPAGGQVMLELAHNRGQTSLSFGGAYAGDYPNGLNYTGQPWQGPGNPPGCIEDDGAMHTQNQSMAAGTALAISYESDITQVTIENLVVISTLANSPWWRKAYYDIPAKLPPCPPGGCHCAWLWIPNGCGEPNMYMAGYKCQVTGATSNVGLQLPAKPPVYCGDNTANCITGPKQMMAWNQQTGNNVSPPNGISPAYAPIMGYSVGAQNDIFASVLSSSPPPTSSPPSNTPTGVSFCSSSGSCQSNTVQVKNPGQCFDWSALFPSNQGLEKVIPTPGFCVVLHAGASCTGTASGSIGSGNPITAADAYWQTHTVSYKMYKTVNGQC